MIPVYAHAIFYVMCFCVLCCVLCHHLTPVYPRQIATALEKCEIEKLMWFIFQLKTIFDCLLPVSITLKNLFKVFTLSVDKYTIISTT